MPQQQFQPEQKAILVLDRIPFANKDHRTRHLAKRHPVEVVELVNQSPAKYHVNTGEHHIIVMGEWLDPAV